MFPWMSTNYGHPEVTKKRKKILLFLHPDKVGKLKPEWAQAAAYFDIRIKEMADSLQNGYEHYLSEERGEDCQNCNQRGVCNQGLYEKLGVMYEKPTGELNGMLRDAMMSHDGEYTLFEYDRK